MFLVLVCFSYLFILTSSIKPPDYAPEKVLSRNDLIQDKINVDYGEDEAPSPERRKRSDYDDDSDENHQENDMMLNLMSSRSGKDNRLLNPEPTPKPMGDSGLYKLTPLVLDMVLDLSIKMEPEFQYCGEVQPIYNGYVFPWQAIIYTEIIIDNHWKKERICGGTLISKAHVITHYECLLDPAGKIRSLKDFIIEFGRGTITNFLSRQSRKIKSIATPEDLPSMKDAIVFLTLNGELGLTAFVHPVCLSLNKTKEREYMKFNNVGSVPIYDSHSARAQVQSIISYKNCSKVYKNASWKQLSDDIFCGSAVMQDHPNSLCTIDKGNGYVVPEPNKQGQMRYFLRGVFTSSVDEKECSTKLKFIRLTSDANKVLLLYTNTWFNDDINNNV